MTAHAYEGGEVSSVERARPAILFLVSTLQDARCTKRVLGLAPHFDRVTVAGFSRPVGGGAAYDCEVVQLGFIEHGLNLRRGIVSLRCLRHVSSLIQQADIVYAFGLDMLLIARLAGASKRTDLLHVLEVGDVRGLETNAGWLSMFIQRVTAKLVRPVKILVATSERFITEYYHQTIGRQFETEVVLSHLVPDGHAHQLPAPDRPPDSRIRIGYFGRIRCERSIDLLARLVSTHGERFRLVVRGEWMLDAERKRALEELPGATVHGRYQSPDELSTIYSDVDVIWVGYPYLELRGRLVSNRYWARTTRFFEALSFGRPMIGQLGTADGEVIQKAQLGPTIPLEDPDTALSVLSGKTWSDVERWTASVRSHPSGSFAAEHQELADAMKGAVDRTSHAGPA